MDEERQNRDFSKGPVWDPKTNRWLVEIRYPDGTRFRKRVRRQREAMRLWGSEEGKIDDGSWDARAPKNVTLSAALEAYRTYSKVQHRSFVTYVAPALAYWEQLLGPHVLLAKITPGHVEEGKLERAKLVSRGTVDKALSVLKAFFNWSIARGLAASNPVRRVKLFHEDTSRLRYLTREEYDRLLEAARTVPTSPYLVEKIVLATHTGLRRGSLFNLRWEQIDLANRVMRIPRTKSGKPLAVPLNGTAVATLQTLYDKRDPDAPYVFPHRSGPNVGQPVMDIKNGFHAALALADIQDFTWHDLRHTFASWLMMRGASLRAVGELLGHQSMKMTMRYAHLSPAFLSAEVGLLDPPPAPIPEGNKRKRARKGQGLPTDKASAVEVPKFVKDFGSPHWTISATG